MDSEIEDKIVSLQVCIDAGHSFEIDRDSFNNESIVLICSRCEYSKVLMLTDEQIERFNKLFEDEDKLLDDVLKNK